MKLTPSVIVLQHTIHNGVKRQIMCINWFFYFVALTSGKMQNHKNIKQNDNIISGSEFQVIIYNTVCP